MSTRTDYQRPAGYGATRASIKAGLSYEKKVWEPIFNLVRDKLLAGDKTLAGWSISEQERMNGGYADYVLRIPKQNLKYIIEVKSQWSLDAYNQLLRYAGSELSTVSRVCICKTFHPHIRLPEQVKCLYLRDLLAALPGEMTIIPWSGRCPIAGITVASTT